MCNGDEGNGLKQIALHHQLGEIRICGNNDDYAVIIL